jgi:hypothetical protein
MRDILIRLFKFQPLNDHSVIYPGLIAVWLALLGVTFSSIASQNFYRSARTFWVLLVVFVPLGGLGIYLLRCLFCADYAFLTIFKGQARGNEGPAAPRLKI